MHIFNFILARNDDIIERPNKRENQIFVNRIGERRKNERGESKKWQIEAPAYGVCECVSAATGSHSSRPFSSIIV